MIKFLTAENISSIQSEIPYRDILALLKYGDFKTTQKIAKNRTVITQQEFLEYAKRKGITIDYAKLTKVNDND